MSDIKYTVILEREDDGGYHVFRPARLPSQGDDLEEAPANIEEAVDIYVENIIADGERLPGVDYNGTG